MSGEEGRLRAAEEEERLAEEEELALIALVKELETFSRASRSRGLVRAQRYMTTNLIAVAVLIIGALSYEDIRAWLLAAAIHLFDWCKAHLFAGTVLAFIAGTVLFVVRWKARFLYALTELAFAATVVAIALSKDGSMTAFLSGVYIFVRGLSNAQEGRVDAIQFMSKVHSYVRGLKTPPAPAPPSKALAYVLDHVKRNGPRGSFKDLFAAARQEERETQQPTRRGTIGRRPPQ